MTTYGIKCPSEAELDKLSSQVMDGVFSDLETFRPYRIDAKTIIVPDTSNGEWDLLGEIVEVCGMDSELWDKDQGYFRLMHP